MGKSDMNKIKKGWENPALGILPIMMFLLLDECFPYLQAYTVSALCCFVSIFVLHILKKERIYSFLLLPASIVFLLYALFLFIIPSEEVFSFYTPVITEILLVVTLIYIRSLKRLVYRYIRNMAGPAYQKAYFLTSLNEFYFVAYVFQNLYTLHLFVVMLYSIMPDSMHSGRMTHFFYCDMGILIGLCILIYEQIRILMVQGRLKKEMWLPVLNDQGTVVGCIAYSVSRLLPKKYYHPIVRVAIVYNGMLYLVKRSAHCFVSASSLDYPVSKYVLFRQSLNTALRDALAPLAREAGLLKPHLLIRYVFENRQVKHQVSLFVVCLKNETQVKLNACHHQGKFWTVRQIEENLGTGVFSEYFEKEFPYMKNTVLFAENLVCSDEK